MENSQHSTLLKEIGRKICLHRKRKFLTQTAFAKKIGCNQKYVSNLECGKANLPIDKLEKIGRILDVQINVVFYNINQNG